MNYSPFPTMMMACQAHVHPFRSISVLELQKLIRLLPELSFFRGNQTSKISSNDIRMYLQAGNPHLAWIFPECFSSEPPQAALTYEWTLHFDDIFSYLNDREIAKCNRKWNADVPTDMNRLQIWIDILFIDQVHCPRAMKFHWKRVDSSGYCFISHFLFVDTFGTVVKQHCTEPGPGQGGVRVCSVPPHAGHSHGLHSCMVPLRTCSPTSRGERNTACSLVPGSAVAGPDQPRRLL